MQTAPAWVSAAANLLLVLVAQAVCAYNNSNLYIVCVYCHVRRSFHVLTLITWGWLFAAGDPIEIGAVVSAYDIGPAAAEGSSSSREAPFLFFTIKGYAGHSEAGAGTVGVLEAVAIMQQQALAPVLHVRQLNPYVAQPLEGRSALINRSAGLAPVSHWQHSEGLVALGVSSFGAQVRAATRSSTALHWIALITASTTEDDRCRAAAVKFFVCLPGCMSNMLHAFPCATYHAQYHHVLLMA
jgi:hypothetical protein